MPANNYVLSVASQKVVRLAQELASEYANPTFEAGHMLWAVVNEDIGLTSIMGQLREVVPAIQRWSLNEVQKLPKSTRYLDTIPAGRTADVIFQETQKLCIRYDNEVISPVDILEALCTPDVGFDAHSIRRLPIALYEVIEWREEYYASLGMDEDDYDKDQKPHASSPPRIGANNQEILSKYCEDLNQMAAEGHIDPVIGRDSELKQLIEILGKRLSPNVLIVGEPGVGKTALVEGLALRIEKGKVPDSLSQATIFSLDVSGRLVAGAFKGEVEERMKSILKSAKDYGVKVILFIDEIHILLDDKGPVGSGVVNLLKPELARGGITVIGATTQAEYRKYVEKDSAFDRRFSILTIQEPDEIIAAEMLQGLAPKYEEYHSLDIAPDAIPTTVKLAKKYVRDRFLPASAIELLDFTMACAVQMNATSQDVINDIEQDWDALNDPTLHSKYINKLQNQLSELLIGKLNEGEDTLLTVDLSVTLNKLKNWTEVPKKTIQGEDVEAITAYRSGIPIGRLRTKEQEKLANIKEILKRRVVGQDHVIDAVAKGLKAFRANLKDPKEPGAIFFFTGPTGTGKTELAKAIAELLFDDEDAMIRFDMSEYQESHSVATLLGAPPGYVGYDEGGILVNHLRKQPYSVVLFDEIEKAHQDIYGIFLQMLTDSRLQDKQGKTADFSNTIIIFTSNAGAQQIVEHFNKGEHPTTEQLKQLLRDTREFKDEFLGRVDSQILPFAPINEEVAKLIFNIHFQKFVRLLKKQHDIRLKATDALTEYMVEAGFSPLYGARPLRNTIKSILTPPLAHKIIMGEVLRGDSVTIDIDDERNLEWSVDRIEGSKHEEQSHVTTAELGDSNEP